MNINSLLKVKQKTSYIYIYIVIDEEYRDESNVLYNVYISPVET